ncbi:hypothetical protein [Novosphingobium sp. B 225]|uniref:hypothetical protein n=1 Tax=Novosphingobium sp. B 225 TaxID=1961849 RepID=UPI000B4BFEC4|nr:hypothetical protein [Novosphingobium sp. B 225]
MKIDPTPIRPALAPAKPLIGGPGASFTQLLESGSSAASVIADRALSFAEGGVLGVHSAVLLDAAASTAGPADAASPPARPERFAPWSGPELIAVADLIGGPAGAQAPAAAAASPLQAGPIAADPAPRAAAPPLQTAAQTLALAAAPAARPAAAAPGSAPAITRRAAWFRPGEPEQAAGQVQFELHTQDAQTIAVVTDMSFDRLDEHDLGQIRERILREFGVTVGRIVVRSKQGIPLRNQGGN